MSGRNTGVGEELIWLAVILVIFLMLAMIVTPIVLVGIPSYVFYRLYKESPRRLERLAREETKILYNHALSGQVHLSDDEIDAALSHHWPPDAPEALKIQLLEIGWALLDDEGLSPEIPPMPALCNTIEGARYRDMLARLGQARSDKAMVMAALDVISKSLATIAQAVPPIAGDVLVDVTQFVHPLGQAVQNVIAPFFADNDYNHFKRLRARVDANLSRTHRTQPIFPSDYKGDDVVDTYLAGTRLERFRLCLNREGFPCGPFSDSLPAYSGVSAHPFRQHPPTCSGAFAHL